MDNRCKLFIGGLSLATTTPKLGQFFQRWGTVVDSNVMVNPSTQQSRGFGFITYADPSMVDVAMKSRPHVIDGRSVESKRPMPREMASSGSNVSCNKLLVRSSSVEINSPFNVQTVRTYFQNFGNVVNVTPPMGATGDFVVHFDDYDPVDKAILHGVHQLNGKTLVISKDTNSPVPQPGGGGINNGRLDCKVFVGGLDHATTDISLSQYFGQYGEVTSTHVMIDPTSGRSRGFGFVTFGDGASVDKALAQRPHQIDGRSVDVKRFESRESLSHKTGNSVVVKNGNNAANMCRLFVGGLSQVTNDDKLRSYFGKYGEIVNGLVMKDPVTKRSRGFAFITFDAPEAVDAVMVDRPHSLDDKQVEVKRPMPKELAGPENTITVKKLFVGAVKDGTTDEQMRQHFETFGNIVDLCLPMDRNSGRLRGFAFIEYDDYDAADKAMVVGHHQVNGKVLDVKKALSKDEMARVSSATAAKQAKNNQDGGGYYGQQQQQQGGYGAPQGGYGYPQGNTGYGAPQGYGGGYGAPQGQGGYGAPQGQGGYGAPQGQGGYGAPQGQGGYGAPQGQGGYGPPPVQGGYGAPQGQGGYGAPQGPGGYTAPQGQGGYNAPQGPGGYTAPQGPGGYGAPPGQGGYNAPQGQGGYGAPPAQGGYTAPQGQGGYGAPPGQGGYTAPQGQGGYGAPPGQGGYTAPQGQGGYVAPKVEGGSGDGFNGTGQGAGGGPIRAGQNYRQSPYNTNQRGGGPPPTGKPPALTGPPPHQPAPNNQGYVRY